MNNLQELVNKCKGSVSLEANAHRDCYETIEQYINGNPFNEDIWNETEPDVKQKIIETNTLIEIQFYPLTPIGFYRVYHYDVNEAINEALKILSE